MTKIALRVEQLGTLLRDSIARLRQLGRSDTEQYRVMVRVFGDLASLIAVMEAEGEIDPAEALRVQEALTPEFRKLVTRQPGTR